MATLLALVAVLLFHAEVHFPYPSNEDKCEHIHEPISFPELVDRFSQALRIKTITRDHHDYDGEPLREFANFLQTSKYKCKKLFNLPRYLVFVYRFSNYLFFALSQG